MNGANVELDTQVVDHSYHGGEEEMDLNGVTIPRSSQFFVSRMLTSSHEHKIMIMKCNLPLVVLYFVLFLPHSN